MEGELRKTLDQLDHFLVTDHIKKKKLFFKPLFAGDTELIDYLQGLRVCPSLLAFLAFNDPIHDASGHSHLEQRNRL